MCTKSRLGNGYIYSTGKIEIYLYYLKTNLVTVQRLTGLKKTDGVD